MLLLFVMLAAMAWGYNEIFTGRAAMLHLGAFTATIMTANVFFIIMPNQRIVVADLKAGRIPDAKYGKIAKLRSTHNNYLTLPVIFLMLSNHNPLAFATQYNWIIACLVFLMGVTIRHWFNTHHARAGNPHWTWFVTALLFFAILWLSAETFDDESEDEEAALSPRVEQIVAKADFEPVRDIISGKCSLCHSAYPGYEGILWAPKGVKLDSDAHIVRHAKEIYIQAAVTKAMPPPSANWITEEERKTLRKWYRGINQ